MAEQSADVIKALQREIKSHKELVKMIDSIRRLPDHQRKQVEAIIGPVMDSDELYAVMQQAERTCHQAEMKLIGHTTKKLDESTPKLKGPAD